MLAIMVAIGLALDQGTSRTSAVEDSLLGDVYEDGKTVLVLPGIRPARSCWRWSTSFAALMPVRHHASGARP